MSNSFYKVDGWQSFWDKSILSRVLAFCWIAWCHKILSIDNLRRKCIIVNGYPLCLKDEETINHLMIHCVFANKIWAFFLNMFEVQWVMPQSDYDLFCLWHLGCKFVRGKILLKSVLYASLWKLSWTGILDSSVEEVVDSAVWFVSEWVSRRKEFDGVPLEDFNRSWVAVVEGFGMLKLSVKLLGCLLL